MKNPPDIITARPPAKRQPAKVKSPIVVLQERFGAVAQLVTQRNSDRTSAALRDMVEISGRFAGDRDRAMARLEKISDRVTLNDQRDVLLEAVYQPAPEREVRAIFGLMLEGIPSAASGATSGYGDTLTFSIMHADEDRDPSEYPRWRGFSAAVLFATARRLWERSTFTPSVAEVLGCARQVRQEYFSAFAATNRLLDIRANAEGVVEDSEPYDDADDFGDESEIPF
jgi:hypothetical protein